MRTCGAPRFEHQIRQRPDQRIEPVRAFAHACGVERAHLVFQLGEARAHGARDRAHKASRPVRPARVCHGAHAPICIAMSGATWRSTVAHNLAAIVGFSDDAIGLKRARQFGCAPGPIQGLRALHTCVRQHHRAARIAFAPCASRDNAARIGFWANARPADRPRRRYGRTRLSSWPRNASSSLRRHRAPGIILNNIAEQFLTILYGARPARIQRGDEIAAPGSRHCPNVMPRVTATSAPLHQLLQHLHRLRRRRRQHQRPFAKPKTVRERIQSFFGMRPKAKLIGPCRIELRPAQRLRIFRRKACACAPLGQTKRRRVAS